MSITEILCLKFTITSAKVQWVKALSVVIHMLFSQCVISMEVRCSSGNILVFVGSTHWGQDKFATIADDIYKSIFLSENVQISLKISLKFVPQVRIRINNIPGLVQIMAWRRSGDKPLSQPMIVSLLTHICVTRPHWVEKPRQFGYMESCMSANVIFNDDLKQDCGNSRVSAMWICHRLTLSHQLNP